MLGHMVWFYVPWYDMASNGGTEYVIAEPVWKSGPMG